jgi:Ca2+/H+ antiporter
LQLLIITEILQRIFCFCIYFALKSCLLVACCLALFLTRHLGYVAKPLSTDDGLLFLTMSGSLIFEIAVIVAAITHIGSSDNSQLVHLDLAASALASVQTVLQVNCHCILDNSSEFVLKIRIFQ